MSETATATKEKKRRKRPSRTRRFRPKGAEFRLVPIRLIPVKKLRASPENDQLYRPVDPADREIIELARSIAAHGVQEPLIVTADHYVVSGHRRLAGAKLARLAEVPCRVLCFRKDDEHERFMQLLRESNRQRIKSFDEKLREEIVSANPELAYRSLIEHRESQSRLTLDTIDLRERKVRKEITTAKLPFLNAIIDVMNERKNFWPLSDRQIHYALLNDPPLIHASKPDSVYHNDKRSYGALVELLTRARVAGRIPMRVIQDATSPVVNWDVHRDVQGFIRREVDHFCKNFSRDLMQSQPNHVEIVGEKNTIEPIIRPVAARYCIPYTIGRGYCSLRPRYDIAERFRKSGKDRLVLLILSDHDPDGEEIAHSLARSLRDDFEVWQVEPIKVALTADQVEKYELPPAMTANENSANYRRFVGEHGEQVWELEALPPETLQDILREVIDQVIDVEALNHEIDEEKSDATKLAAVRRVTLDALGDWRGEE